MESVATVSATTPPAQSATPSGSAPAVSRVPMMSSTPSVPAARPATPSGRVRSERSTQFARATSSGRVDAMIAARLACTVCMAVKLSPR